VEVSARQWLRALICFMGGAWIAQTVYAISRFPDYWLHPIPGLFGCLAFVTLYVATWVKS
jgi:hypothetical protein